MKCRLPPAVAAVTGAVAAAAARRSALHAESTKGVPRGGKGALLASVSSWYTAKAGVAAAASIQGSGLARCEGLHTAATATTVGGGAASLAALLPQDAVRAEQQALLCLLQ